MSDNLQTLRSKIDQIDDQLLQLLSKRAEIALAVKRAKGKSSTFRPAREAVIIRRMVAANKSQLSPRAVEAVYREIIAVCRNLEETLRISYLGPVGSYSYEAALKLAGSTSELIAQTSFTEALHAAESGTVDAALLAIENSSEGMVAETHKLLRITPLVIIGEVVLRIRHCLLTNSKKLSDVQEMHAHPQALGQCRTWLQIHTPQAELVAESSNSRAAEVAARKPHTAAIASAKAAELFGLPILARNINDDLGNQTRFILLSKQPADRTGKDKTSLICMVENRPGSLHDLLGVFAAHNINLIRLESQPVSAAEYAFYLDFDGHASDDNVAQTIEELANITRDIINLGSYPQAIEA